MGNQLDNTLLLGKTNTAGAAPVRSADEKGWELLRVGVLEPSPQAIYSGAATTIVVDNALFNVIQAKFSAALNGNAATLANPTSTPPDQAPLVFRFDNQSGADVALSFSSAYVLFGGVGTAPLTLASAKVAYLVARYSAIRGKFEIIGCIGE